VSAPHTVIHALEKNRLTTGSVVQMFEAAKGLSARGHRVTVVTRSGGDLEDACRASGLGLLILPLRSEFDLRSARILRAFLRRQPADVIHVHKGRAHSVSLMAATGLGPKPVVVVNRGVSFGLDSFNKWKYRHSRVGAVVCVAEAIRKQVVASTGLPARRAFTIHSGTDLQRFDPERVCPNKVRKELGLSPGHLLVGQVSVRDWKGWQELLTACTKIMAQRPRVHLVLVGCEPASERDKVKGAAAAAGLLDSVHTLSFRTDMPEVLATCDIVADASWAGTGVTGTIREAMAMARPVVATRCGGNDELVTDQKSGLLVPPRDTSALANALARLADNRELRIRLGAAGRARVATSFSAEHKLNRLQDLYYDLVMET
jgi:glycosyltransferase involved in cell wall biosynthesis